MSTPSQFIYKQMEEDRKQRIDQAMAYRALYPISPFGLCQNKKRADFEMFVAWGRFEKSGRLKPMTAYYMYNELVYNYESRYGFAHTGVLK